MRINTPASRSKPPPDIVHPQGRTPTNEGNSSSVDAYTGQVLVPTLLSGEMVIMDNLPAHKVANVRIAMEATRANLRLFPSYSPDLNPIEFGLPSSRYDCSAESHESFPHSGMPLS